MLILAFAFAAQVSPSQAVDRSPTFTGGPVSAPDTLMTYWNYEDGGKVAQYDVATDTLTFGPGYDCNDIARVVAGLPPTRLEGDTQTILRNSALANLELDIGTTTAFVETNDADVDVLWAPPLWFIAGYSTPFLGAFGAMSVGETLWFLAMGMLCVNLFWRRRSYMSEPASTPPAPDGLLDSAMTYVFGRSWRTGLSGFAGVALTIVAAASSVEPPFTFQKLAPLLPGLVASLGLMVAKDGKVSHTQMPPPK